MSRQIGKEVGSTWKVIPNLQAWIVAVRRADKKGKKWAPTARTVVCRRHFTEQDYMEKTVEGMNDSNTAC